MVSFCCDNDYDCRVLHDPPLCTVYFVPYSSGPRVSYCMVDHCYYLMYRINNQHLENKRATLTL